MAGSYISRDWRFEFHDSVWLAYHTSHMKGWLSQYADAVVQWARYFAPKRTGAGARSIHWEYDASSQQVRIGPDEMHHYMVYQELGTRYMRPRPYLRPALTVAERGTRVTASGGFARPSSFPAAGVPLDAYYSG